jgi:hypothetical protein
MLANQEILKIKAYKKFALSLFLLNLFLFSGYYESYWGTPKILKYGFSIITLFFVFRLIYFSKRLTINNYLDLFFRGIFIFISILLLAGSIRIDAHYVQNVLGDRYYFMPFLIPIFFILIKYRIDFFKILMNYTYYLLYLSIIVEVVVLVFFRDLIFYGRGMTAIYTFAIAPFLLVQISHLFENKKIGQLLFFYLGLFTVIAAIWGRRGETLEPLFFIFAALLIRFTSKSVRVSNKAVLLIISIVFSLTVLFVINEYSNKIYLFERGINKDAFEETRGETIYNFLHDFGSKPYDWLIGRGLNGEFRKFTWGYNQMSTSIEIGYFNILLKGGFIYLIPMMYLFLRAFYLGFFKSCNDLSKGLALIVLWQIIYMVSFAMANYSPYYILVWIAVGAGFDPNLRSKSNMELKAVFNSR